MILRVFVCVVFPLIVAANNIYVGLCNWTPSISFVYMSGVCIVDNGKLVMADYCGFGKGDSSDKHIQNGYRADIYRKEKSPWASNKDRVQSAKIRTPNDIYRLDVKPDSNCEDVDVSNKGRYYDVYVSGDISATAMILCRQWCNDISHGKSGIKGTQKCGKPTNHDEL